ncbi:MAG: hypothetical protein QOJ62_3029 [Actinomycetota bacterium]|jgi:hypothetical protein|nr:hypothetical protein [Actinomycetota bacterium]
MSQTLLAAQTFLAGHQLHLSPHIVAALPKPKAAVTVPVIVIFAALVLIGLVRKVMFLAVIAALVCIGFLAYQSGAFTN